MTETLNLFDRMRIERVVWSLDQRLYDLPRRTRIATRREVRANLRAAAHDVGTTIALRRLGNAHSLAEQYLDAEFGDAPRPSWIAAGLFVVGVQLLLTWLLAEAADAFAKGIVALSPHATGTYSWRGIRYVQSEVTFTLTDGRYRSVGGAWTPLVWILWIGGTIAVGRLWRLVPAWRRRRAAAMSRR